MVKARKWVVVKRFEGLPKRSDFEIVEEELLPLKDGEILVKTEYISVDPYLRAYAARSTPPYDQFSYQVGTVVESKSPKYKVGTRIVSHSGWRDYAVIDMEKKDFIGSPPYVLPDLGSLSVSQGIGAVGMPGATAYFGFLNICEPKKGETVVVTGAAGAVGSIVGQIAKIKGCKVIGFAGSDDKTKVLTQEYGFDYAFNYKTSDIAKVLKQAAPNGVDCYFDNVGGEISSIILSQMNTFGRVSVCGSISVYNEDATKMPKATVVQRSIVTNQLRIEGFIVWRWVDDRENAFKQLAQWIHEGKLKAKEHLTEGFENTFDAFVGMLQGDNIGKAVVKV